LPGSIVIGLVIIARLTGALQFLEWFALDTFLRLRYSPEPIDERIVIVGINEADIKRTGTYPLPDREIANLIKTLQQYEPRAIGLDLVRDIPVEPGHAELVKVFKASQNLIGVEKLLAEPIAPPPDLPSERVSFADTLPDADGNTRRSLLGLPRPEDPQKYAFSFPLLLAKAYLESEGIELGNGTRDPQAMQFGSTELPRFLSNSGGYVRADDFGVQVLLNFRQGRERFRLLSLDDIKTRKFNPNWMRDRLVLIGMTSPSVKDFINTSAIADLNPPGKIYGVEFHAQVASQIISAVKDGRPLLKTWSDGWEYLWILGWGILGISLGRLTQSPSKNLLSVVISSISLIGIGYLLLLEGWWIPVAPALLVLVLNGIGLTAFYQYDRALRAKIDERQRTIEHTFTVIHNGPLQTLANILRRVRDQNLPQEQLQAELENLNQEIREVGEYLKREALIYEESLRLGSGLKLDLKRPLHELFYEVYSSTLERNLSCFQTLKVKVRSFDPIEEQQLSIEQKQELCQFLEEALCNVGKHAQGVTRLSATGKNREGKYTLSIKDNGLGNISSYEGRGTKQCKNLAKQLGGKFKREFLSPRGTLCELTWSITES
jgi:CHASE2 domain-containing sensor protein/two-component sensor histidine kinase